MRKLVNLEYVEETFKDITLTNNWTYALKNGTTFIYDEDLILNWYIEEEVCIINSGSFKNNSFNREILRDIRRIIAKFPKIIISSSVLSIEPFLKKKGFSYNIDKKIYWRF